MPNIPQILRARRRRRKKYANTSLRFSGLSFATSLSILAAIFFIGATLVYISLTKNLPALETIPALLEPPNGLLLQPTRFYDRLGTHILLELEHPAITERQYLRLTDKSDNSIPEDIIHATIANSDPTFWEHPGVTNFSSEPDAHQTLAQRLVADLLMWNEMDSRRQDLRERLMAAQITGQYGRQQVLEWYLNSAYFGNQVYGISSASQAYFGKSVDQLNLAEIGILAAIAHEPSINPIDTPDTSIERGIIVIDKMLSEGYISSGEALKARKTEITFQENPTQPENIAPAFMKLVREQLSLRIPDKRLERGGFEIFTSLNYDLQEQATCTTLAHLTNLAGAEISEQDCETARLLPSLVLDDGNYDRLESNSIVLDPLSGQILAMVGETTPGLDPAHLPGHAPGSLLTPFAYLTAFTRGLNPASLLWEIPSTFSQSINQITNPTDEFRGPMRLRVALANDYMIPALGTINQIGAENVWRTVGQFGINLPTNLSSENLMITECPGCQYLLDGGDVTLLDMAQAFGIFANFGSFVGEVNLNEAENRFNLEPVTLLRVNDLHGGEWIVDQSPITHPVTSPQIAYLINHMLSDESTRWESLGHPNPLEIGQPVAAKMGRTITGNDIWTIGYTPHLVVGVWMGRGDSDSLEGGHLSPKVSSALWHAIIKYAARNLPAESWAAPPGINTLTVCDPSGMLPTGDCPTVVSEVFLSGQEPTQPDTLFQNYQINRETGRLATVFTPPELIEERVFLIVPPEASQWAIETGIPAPPEVYDVIYAPSPSPDTRLTAPVIFTNIRGEQTIQGTASGSNFVSYRLQVGKGLNPRSWLAISEDVETPVVNGTLATWDTSGLSGLYAVQLVVIRSDQQVETDTIQVTIDNQPPEILIVHPQDNQIFDYQATVPVTFQLQVSDNIGVEQVDYFLNGNLVDTQSQPPYAYAWLPRIGDHILEISVVDLAGNEARASVSFSIQR